MYLKRLEIQGFKSFANHAVLEFQPGITSIVGPNGSGKSNISDAIRWVLGEQSKTLLRGKKAEDVIFAGSASRARGSMASCSLVFDNEDKKLPIDSAEVVITRRLHRDGTSEYLINNEGVRLMDITEVLSKAGFAQSRYTVIGQGIIDQFLLQGPAEIKAVIEEAAGLAPFYDKHEKTIRRLQVTRENLVQVTGLISEIEPRLRTLRRQAKRLEQRAIIENQWKELFAGRLNYLLGKLRGDKQNLDAQIEKFEQQIKALGAEVQQFFSSVQQEDRASAERSKKINEIQSQISQEQKRKDKLQIELAELRAKLSSQTKQDSNFAAVKARNDELNRQYKELTEQLHSFETNIAETERDINEIIEILNTSKPDLVPRLNLIAEKFLSGQKQFVEKLSAQKEDLSKALERSSVEMGAHSSGSDVASSLKELEHKLNAELEQQNGRIADLQNALQAELNKISSYTSERQQADQQIRAKESQLNQLRSQQGELKVKLATTVAHIGEEERKAREDLGENFEEVIVKAQPIADESADEQALSLKRQLDMIGGLDEMTLQEYEETEQRYAYLTSQVGDLERAAKDLEEVLAELNGLIKTKFNEAFDIIAEKFSNYFRMLFNGGKADLKKQKEEKNKPEEGEQEEEMEQPVEEQLAEQPTNIIGVEVTATPPGKKLSSIAALSGGERTLTTIALLIAMLDAYPSPFVVLDEVDAALDESNSIRFAKILGELADQTQFVTITHNRETMRRAHTLYGVTMNEGGVSQLLSIKFDESMKYAKD